MTTPREWFRNGFKVGPNYGRPPAAVAGDWIDAGNASLRPESGDYSHWWAVFNDPVLGGLIQEAHDQNLPLKIAGMRILEARSQLGVARGSLFPQQQQMKGGLFRSELSENSYPFGEFMLPKMTFDTWSIGFDAAWELDFWGRFRRAVESAEANLDAQVENYDDVLVILQAEVAANYVQMRTLEERLRLAHKNVELQRDTLRITEDRFAKGMVSQLDVQQARAILAGTESLIPVFEMNHRKARNRLCTLMGLPPQDLEARLGTTGTIPSAPPEVAVGIPAELLRRRPDLRRAERQAAAQCARIGVAESEFYPHIAITGNIGFEAENVSQLFDWDSIAAGVGPGFRWNILNYGRIRNGVWVEDARFGQAVLGYQEAVLRAAEETEGAITSYLREQVRVRALQRSTEAVGKAVELANIQYQQGLIDFQRVVDSERALVVQQDQLAESRGNVAMYLVAVYKALGGGWQARFAPAGVFTTTEAQAAPRTGEASGTPAPRTGEASGAHAAPMPPERLPVMGQPAADDRAPATSPTPTVAPPGPTPAVPTRPVVPAGPPTPTPAGPTPVVPEGPPAAVGPSAGSWMEIR